VTVHGSLCTGYGGLDRAVGAVFGGELAWLAEYEDAPAQVCDVRFPGVPNLHDLTSVDWTQVEPVDVLTAGYPCQPFSHAGSRQGVNDARHLWPYIADAVRVLRPGLVVLENVAGHLSLGFDVVLGDLAALGFDAEWCVLRASDVGACHQRARLFVVAAPNPKHDGRHVGPVGRGAGQGEDEGGVLEPEGRVAPAAAVSDGAGAGRDGRAVPRPATASPARPGAVVHPAGAAGEDPADTDREGLEGPEPAGRRHLPAWGDYEAAIERHEHALGRPAPAPTDDRGRLNPPFVEWMMMLPDGWVTDVLTSRTKALKCLGNGVVPAQAEAAVRMLLPRLLEREAAA
jgi:DNA (cytosine-5)-methyltransferase 1